jgi:hypothetical protein
MSGPSDKAVEAARATVPRGAGRGLHQTTDAALDAAHDPALGLDRSVCLRDVLKVIGEDDPGWPELVARQFLTPEAMEREFGE